MLAGMPIAIPECRVAIKQPSVEAIVASSESNFFDAVQFFVNAASVVEPLRSGNSRLAQLPDFQLLMIVLEEDLQFRKIIEDFFELVFPDYFFRFDVGSVNFFLDENKTRIIGQINPMNFEKVQQTIKTLFLPHNTSSDPEYNPSGDLAAEIAAKLKAGNKKRQELKQKQNEKNIEKSLFASYISILSVGLSLDLHILYSYTPFQLYNIFMRYTAKMRFDLYQKVATTPMMDVSNMDEPNNWIDSIYQ